jgi:hypothetical protein
MNRPDNAARVVITGMGQISPLGNTPVALWDALSSGRSGVDRLASLPVENLTTSFAGEARGFTGDIADFSPPTERQKQIRSLADVPRDADRWRGNCAFRRGLPGPAYPAERIGVVSGPTT